MYFIWDTFNPYRAKLIQAYGQSFIKLVVKQEISILKLYVCVSYMLHVKSIQMFFSEKF